MIDCTCARAASQTVTLSPALLHAAADAAGSLCSGPQAFALIVNRVLADDRSSCQFQMGESVVAAVVPGMVAADATVSLIVGF
jgi:hypothetical protein